MQRISRYYPGCDGTKLAVDLYLPELAPDQKIPAVFHMGNDPRRMRYDTMAPFITRLVEEGYAVVLPEPRGVGVSFGCNEGFFNRTDGHDAAVLIDTIAAEDWCSGEVGMFGGSNLGNIQELAATWQPKALKCIIPCDCNANGYYQNYPNGASALPMPGNFAPPPGFTPVPPVPVDDDPEGIQAAKALEEHKGNGLFLAQYMPNMHRDTVHPRLGYATNTDIPVWSHMDKLRYSDLKIYQNAAWYDPGCTGSLISYKSWGGKVVLGPWRHVEIYNPSGELPGDRFDWMGEHIRFFDAVLKDSDATGTLREPDIRYYTRNEAPGSEWKYTADWPLDNQLTTRLYLTPEGEMGPGAAAAGSLDYKVRTDIDFFGFGRLNRKLRDRFTAQQEKCLCFTTQAVPGDLEITGIPVMELWASATWRDSNFIAVLLDVAPDGTTEHITEGTMRASHKNIGRNEAWDSLALPYHPGLTGQDARLDQGVQQLCFNMEGISYILKAGHKLRLCVFCGAADTFQQPEGMPEDVTVTVHTGPEHPSFLRLPQARADVSRFRGTVDGREAEVYAFRKGVWILRDGCWESHPCLQVYPEGEDLVYVTGDFCLRKTAGSGTVRARIPELGFDALEPLPDRWCWDGTVSVQPYLPTGFPVFPQYRPKKLIGDLYVATVPVRKGKPGLPNVEPFATKDLRIDLALPENAEGKLPCIVDIHGYGGTYHQFHEIAPLLVERGYAVASIEYRTYPPNEWPEPALDAKACIRYLKAHADELGLDVDRIGLIGGSMGGHMSAMITATNGDPALEGDIGGNTGFDSSIKASAIYYPWVNAFTFGEQCRDLYPGQTEKVINCDGPFAPLGSMIGFTGYGKGMGELKKHLYDPDPYYQNLLRRIREASPITHVGPHSAPCVLVHGIGECGIQIPMAQSVEFFEAMTRAGIPCQLYCNNLNMFGREPEIRQAVADFLTSRV